MNEMDRCGKGSTKWIVMGWLDSRHTAHEPGQWMCRVTVRTCGIIMTERFMIKLMQWDALRVNVSYIWAVCSILDNVIDEEYLTIDNKLR